MIKLGLIVIASVTGSLNAPAVAQQLSRPLPANTTPGIVEIGEIDDEIAFISHELPKPRLFAKIGNLPLAAIKGDREKAHTTKVGCYPATRQTTCLLDIVADGEREVWFYRAGNGERDMKLVRLPGDIADEFFWSGFRTTIAGDGPLVFAAFPASGSPATIWMEGEGNDRPFHSYELEDPQQPAIVRPSFGGNSIVGLALVLARSTERFVSPAEAIDIITMDRGGTFSRYAVPPNCQVLGAVSDTLICGENVRGRQHVSGLPQYASVMRLNPPTGAVADNVRDLGAPAFQTMDGSVLFRALENGVMRPYRQALADEVASPALGMEANCVDPNEHVDVFEVSAEHTAALLRIYGPLSPQRLILAPIVDDRIHPCSSAAKEFARQAITPKEHESFSIERLRLGKATEVPIKLVSGPNKGPLNGHIMLATYGSFGVTMPERYLGPWLENWVARGGKFAYVHLPGGGGFGAEWARRGFGIQRKIATSAVLDEVTEAVVSEGLALHGKVSILTESAGGVVVANGILRNPERYAVFALRAGCLALEGDRQSDCTRSHHYGDWSDPGDRALMSEFDPLDEIIDEEAYPSIILGIPETDSRVDLDYQRRMARELVSKDTAVFTFEGAEHAERATAKIEMNWVDLIAATALKAADADAACSLEEC